MRDPGACRSSFQSQPGSRGSWEMEPSRSHLSLLGPLRNSCHSAGQRRTTAAYPPATSHRLPLHSAFCTIRYQLQTAIGENSLRVNDTLQCLQPHEAAAADLLCDFAPNPPHTPMRTLSLSVASRSSPLGIWHPNTARDRMRERIVCGLFGPFWTG